MVLFSIVEEATGQKLSLEFTASMTLKQVLEEACKKRNIDPSVHQLKFNKKILDLSLPIRLANIPPNSKIELVRGARAPEVVQDVLVALQLPTGQRLQKKVAASISLWNLLVSFEKSTNNEVNLTRNVKEPPAPTVLNLFKKSKPSPPTYVRPVVSYLNKPFHSADLATTTLSSLGVTAGTVALRVSFEETEITIEDHTRMINSVTQSIPVAPNQPTTSPAPAAVAAVAPSAVAPEVAKPTMNEPDAIEPATQAAASVEPVTDPQMPGNPSSEHPEEASTMTHEDKQSQLNEIPTPQEVESAPVEETSPTAVTESRPVAAVVPAAAPAEPHELGPAENDLMPFSKGFSFDNPALIPSSVPESTPTSVIKPTTSKLKTLDTFKFTPPPRNAVVLDSTKQHDFDPRKYDVPDGFYDQTVDDVMQQLQSAQRQREENEKMLKTKAMRENEEIERALRFKKCVVRIMFPGRLVLQGEFHPLEKVDAVFSFVTESLADPSASFYLYTTPPVHRLEGDLGQTLMRLKLIPLSVIHLRFEGAESPIRPDLIANIRVLEPPSQPAAVVVESTPKSSSSGKPKWLKL